MLTASPDAQTYEQQQQELTNANYIEAFYGLFYSELHLCFISPVLQIADSRSLVALKLLQIVLCL